MYILTLSPLLIYEGRSKYYKFIIISCRKCTNREKRHHLSISSIDYIYINCWFTVYRWSVIEKQIISTPPPPPQHTHTKYLEMCVRVAGWFWLPVFALLTNSRLRTSSYTGNSEIFLYMITSLTSVQYE